MTTATITTDINIGPFKIPSNGQNMIMNNYAQRNNLVVELVIPEPLMTKSFEFFANPLASSYDRFLSGCGISSIHD